MYDIESRKIGLLGVSVLLLFFSFIIGVGLVNTKLSVWEERQKGLAELARAESNRTIKVLESEADKEAAKRYAEAEVIRAHGVAQANAIIGESLKGNEAYLRYRWIEGLQTNQMMTIYVPTEAGLPILEAGRGVSLGDIKK